jgi:hypothetical protein
MDLMTLLIIFGLFLVIVVIVCFAVVAYMWLIPVLPYITAKLQKKDLLILIGKNGKIRLIPAKYSSSMFESAKPPYSFIQRIPKAWRFGDVQAVFVIDNWGIAVDPTMTEGLKELENIGIVNYEDLEEALKSDAEEIRSAKAQNREVDLSKIKVANKTIVTHAFTDVDWTKLMDYIADVSPSEIRAHLDEQIAKIVEEYSQFKPKEGGGISIWMIVMILGLCVIGYLGMKSMGFF